MKIAIFSPPFSGHLNVLLYLKDELGKYHETFLFITGWNNIPPNISDTTNTNNIEIINDTEAPSLDPTNFILTKAKNLSKKSIEKCASYNPHLIIYDFFALEGFITAKTLSVPYYCSIPAMIGPFIKNNKFYIDKISNDDNKQLFNEINTIYQVNLLQCNIQQISNSILIPSDVNILWSYDKIIECDDYTKDRNLFKNNFINIGPRKSNSDIIEPNNSLNDNKIIYISFGSAVMESLWKYHNIVQIFIINLLLHLIDILKNKKEYDVIIALGREEKKALNFNWPSNFKIYTHIDQIKVLKKAHLFITHCGGNSFNEAVSLNVPMIGIPFFGDQHLIASKINKLTLGKAFLHEGNNAVNMHISTEHNPYYRKSLTKASLDLAINDILHNHETYVDNIKTISSHIEVPRSILSMYYNYPLTWKNGDLLYGTQTDRLSFIKYFNVYNDFRICSPVPFSKLFINKTNPTLLPRVIEIYNDSIINNNWFPVESSSNFTSYSNNLKEFKEWLKHNNQFIAPALCFNDINDENKTKVIWNMCVGGIEFFTQIKGYTIHFVMDKFKYNFNLATSKELTYIKDNWDRLNTKISFYKLDRKYGTFSKINPFIYNIL